MGNIRARAFARAALKLMGCAILAVGCGEGPVQTTPGDDPAVSDLDPVQSAAYTHHRADGNRLVEGRGALPDARIVDIALDGVPAWIVAAPTGRSSVWVATLDDGRVQAFRLAGGTSAPVGVGSDQLPAGMPPALAVEGALRARVMVGGQMAAPFSHPVALPDGRTAHIDRSGDLVVSGADGQERLFVDPLPDARLLVDEEGRLALYNRPTTRYAHGVLGDAVEAGGAAIIATVGALRVEAQIDFLPPLVAEGLAPLWVDWDGDGRREIIATLSDERAGARVAIFAEDGTELAASDPVGSGFRWRHVLAWAPLAGGAGELVAVRTPHIGGIVEFYARRAGRLEIAAQLDGFTSHVIGTRNLDMALVGDFDGDGALELLLPNQARTHLAAIGRTDAGARRLWQVALGGEMTTNIAAATLSDGSALVGAGHDGQHLRIWQR